MPTRAVPIGLSVAIAICVFAASPSSGQRVCCWGDTWIRWSQDQRETLVSGYVSGYMEGHEDGCKQGTKDWPGEVKSGYDNPLYKCRQGGLDLSKGSDYFVKAITDFYKRYPEDRDILPHEIMYQLGQGLTLEQIHGYPFWRHNPRKATP